MSSVRGRLCLAFIVMLAGFGRSQAQVTFIDRAPETGTTSHSLGRGASMVDIDGDGLLDLIEGNAEMPNRFFRQLPNHTFEDASSAWGIAFDNRSTWGSLVADFDNDGDNDVYFISGGFISGPVRNQLLRNDLNTGGGLNDVSILAPDAVQPSRDFGGTALDYDRDGDVDIFVSTSDPNTACWLFRNEGGMSFIDVSSAAGITQSGQYHHCSSGDFNNDGWMDIAVGNRSGPNLLYRNNGNGTFTNVAAAAGVESPNENFGMVLEDFDNDGWMDIFLPKFQEPNAPQPSEVYRNNHDGTFTNVTAGSGLTGQPDMGHNTGDLDADGYPDIFIGTGRPCCRFDDALFLMTPNGSGRFLATNVSASSGILANGPTRCHGMAIGDYDQDGFVDIYANNGGIPGGPADSQEDSILWQNQGNANGWTALRLRGVVSNRSAVGARCVAFTSAGREIHRYLRVGNGFANTDSPIQHFGIGQDGSVDRIEITWPSGITQTILNPPMGQVMDVTEVLGGDLNGNGLVGPEDIPLFVDVLVGVDSNPNHIAASDLDGSGLADGNDIPPFTTALLHP